jgi:hypothetical protein
MKYIILLAVLLLSVFVYGQSAGEEKCMQLSTRIFEWEVQNKFDSLDAVLDDNLRVVSSRGAVQTKEQYIATLRGGTFRHDSINVEHSEVSIANSTAILIGKGLFHMTLDGNKAKRHLSFMEVFVWRKKEWKLLALYASVIPD